MGCLDLYKWRSQLAELDASEFSALYRELRERNGTAAFNDAFLAPERLTDEEIREFAMVFRNHGITLTFGHQSEVRDAFLIMMAEAIERSTRLHP